MTQFADSNRYYVPVFIVATILLRLCNGTQHYCSPTQYFDIESESCKACSTCTSTDIIRRTCSYNSDTVCGPFYEFSDFLKKFRTKISPEVQVKPSTKDKNANLKEDTWNSLMLVLIGCLSVFGIVLVVLIVTAVLTYRKRTGGNQLWSSKEELFDDEIEQSTVKDTDKMLSVYVSAT